MLQNRYEIQLEGLNLDRLLEKLRVKEITLYDVKRDSYKKLSFSVSMTDISKLLALPEMKEYLVIKKGKEGLPRIKNWFVSRLGLFIGAVLVLALIFVAQLFTFDIQIMGIEEITEEEVFLVLEQNGIKKNAINDFAVSDIENLLLKSIDKISMVSVAKQGTTILINVKEKTLLTTAYAPIYAGENMIITGITVYGGTAIVKVGDIVKKGDILVDCHVEINGEKIECEPRAEIYADVWITGQVKFAEYEEYYERTGKKQILRTYEIFGKEFFKNNSEIKFENYEIEEYDAYLFKGWFVPVKSKQRVLYELELIKAERDFESEREKTLADSRILAYNQLGNEKVLEETSNICKIGRVYYIQTFLKINKRVA